MAESVWALWHALAGPKLLGILVANWLITRTTVLGSLVADATTAYRRRP